MKQQIIVSGLGGQGALTVTRLLAEAAAALGLPVITSETHGMAQRGGTVISMIKVGPFKGPLIPAGEADCGLFLHPKNLAVHRFYLKTGGAAFVNTATPGDYHHVDARALAASHKLPPVSANLILLGFAAGNRGLFAEPDFMMNIIEAKTPERFRESSLQAFQIGLEASYYPDDKLNGRRLQMKECPNQQTNLAKCNCTYEPCPRKGICCECISYHRAAGELPACYFSPEVERTYDRSIARFIKASR